jgi:hypothetical protein
MRILAAFLFLSSACTSYKLPDIAEPKSFVCDEMQFTYPGNWRITDDDRFDEAQVKMRQVNVESPDDAVFMVSVFTPALEIGLEEYAKRLQQTRNEEAENLAAVGATKLVNAKSGKHEPIEVELGGQKHQAIREEFVISLLGQSLPHVMTVSRVVNPARSAFLVAQAPSEDWRRELPGFEHIQVGFALMGATAPAE